MPWVTVVLGSMAGGRRRRRAADAAEAAGEIVVAVAAAAGRACPAGSAGRDQRRWQRAGVEHHGRRGMRIGRPARRRIAVCGGAASTACGGGAAGGARRRGDRLRRHGGRGLDGCAARPRRRPAAAVARRARYPCSTASPRPAARQWRRPAASPIASERGLRCGDGGQDIAGGEIDDLGAHALRADRLSLAGSRRSGSLRLRRMVYSPWRLAAVSAAAEASAAGSG